MGYGLDEFDLLTTYAHHSELQLITVLSLTYTLYSSPLHTRCIVHFLAADFNTGIITVSLNHMPQISLYYSTHKVFSSQLDFQLSTELARLLHHCQLPTPELSIQFATAAAISSHFSSQSSTLDCQFSAYSHITTLHRPDSKQGFQQYPYCYVFTEPLLRNGFFFCCVHVAIPTQLCQ
jgi:hypothetical protein